MEAKHVALEHPQELRELHVEERVVDVERAGSGMEGEDGCEVELLVVGDEGDAAGDAEVEVIREERVEGRRVGGLRLPGELGRFVAMPRGAVELGVWIARVRRSHVDRVEGMQVDDGPHVSVDPRIDPPLRFIGELAGVEQHEAAPRLLDQGTLGPDVDDASDAERAAEVVESRPSRHHVMGSHASSVVPGDARGKCGRRAWMFTPPESSSRSVHTGGL